MVRISLNITKTSLSGPGQNIMQVNVHLCVGEHKAMSDSKLLAVVGQVDVPCVPHLAQHGVQAHEVHSRIHSTSEINKDFKSCN